MMTQIEMSNPDSDPDVIDQKIQQNIANWQSTTNPLAPLTEEQTDIIYAISDLIKKKYEPSDEDIQTVENLNAAKPIPQINTIPDFIIWMIRVENHVENDNLKDYHLHYQYLLQQASKCKKLYKYVNGTDLLLEDLKEKYSEVIAKTNVLHNLSEKLMTHQKILKAHKKEINKRLHYFIIFNKTKESVERLSDKINTPEYMEILDTIDKAINYLDLHINFKEALIYKIKYESLLSTALNNVSKIFASIILEATKHIVDPESKTAISLNNPSKTDSTFALYYGKFQNVSSKVKNILTHIEEKGGENERYENCIQDCQRMFINNRMPILSAAVSKALVELKEKYKNDFSVLFRSCGTFTMKICQDEKMCYDYFFIKYSTDFNNYLGVLCQYLYDTLRPCLITINHVEVLSELCGILKKEILNEKVYSDERLLKYREIVKQLLEDVEERLVFRTNIFFQNDILYYNPSPGDLAYPEKLEQLESITEDLQESRTNSRQSVVSIESQEVASINSTQLTSQFRSYTGNSPADLHGMWYPTVKRTLVILSRLYCCLDRETFQGLAQEALLICLSTLEFAASKISNQKTALDAKLFQIKHLLILREQIAPFQVDFVAKEMSLDFSNVQKAAIDLIHKRNKLFTFSSNNALLEFLLEGTPKVKEYLVDSRKEIDKALKEACELFIKNVTEILTARIQEWLKMAENYLKSPNTAKNTLRLAPFGTAKVLGDTISLGLRDMKLKIPEIQKSMQVYLANRETESILFRSIKNNIVSVFFNLEQLILVEYNRDEQIIIAYPSPEQINVLVCSVSLTSEQENIRTGQ